MAAEKLGDLPMAVLWVSEAVEGADPGAILGNEQCAQQVSAAILDVIKAVETGTPLAQ